MEVSQDVFIRGALRKDRVSSKGNLSATTYKGIHRKSLSAPVPRQSSTYLCCIIRFQSLLHEMYIPTSLDRR